MAVEVRLRAGAVVPEETELVVHYGAGIDAIDQLITSAIGNYGFYEHIAAEKGLQEPGALVLSVFACTAGVTLSDLLGSAPAAPYSRYGTAPAGQLVEAGWELWPTDVRVDGTTVEFSHVHFDVWLPSGDLEIPTDLPGTPRATRRQLREALRPTFSALLEHFEPRRER
jgi:hypothetical protein